MLLVQETALVVCYASRSGKRRTASTDTVHDVCSCHRMLDVSEYELSNSSSHCISGTRRRGVKESTDAHVEGRSFRILIDEKRVMAKFCSENFTVHIDTSFASQLFSKTHRLFRRHQSIG